MQINGKMKFISRKFVNPPGQSVLARRDSDKQGKAEKTQETPPQASHSTERRRVGKETNPSARVAPVILPVKHPDDHAILSMIQNKQGNPEQYEVPVSSRERKIQKQRNSLYIHTVVDEYSTLIVRLPCFKNSAHAVTPPIKGPPIIVLASPPIISLVPVLQIFIHS